MVLRGKALGYEMLVFCHGYVSNHCLWVLRARGVLHSSVWLQWVCVRIVFVFAQEIQKLFSSLCPTVRLISKLMVSVAKIMWDYCTFSFVTYIRAVRLKRSKINTDLIVHNTFHQPQSLFWDHLIFPTSAGPPSTWSGPNEKVKIWGRYPSNCLHQGNNYWTCCYSNLAVYTNVLQVSWYVSPVAC